MRADIERVNRLAVKARLRNARRVAPRIAPRCARSPAAGYGRRWIVLRRRCPRRESSVAQRTTIADGPASLPAPGHLHVAVLVPQLWITIDPWVMAFAAASPSALPIWLSNTRVPEVVSQILIRNLSGPVLPPSTAETRNE